MNIYYTRGFIELKNNPFYHIEISKFQLGNLGGNPNKDGVRSLLAKEFESLSLEYLMNKGINLVPTGTNYKQFYDLEAILDNTSITLSIEIPKTNVSIVNSLNPYNTIFVLYKNLLDNKHDIAFILIDAIQSGDSVKLSPLSLETDRNIIKIPQFAYSCSIEFENSSDIEFLEGSGLAEPRALRESNGINSRAIEISDPKEKRYVSVVSFESYLQEIRSQDEFDHLDSVFINKFGLKIY